MSKYDRANTTGEKDAIDAYMEPTEQVYWKGKGNKLNYIVNSAGPMTPFALIWLFVDGGIITVMLSSGAGAEVALFLVPFFALHLIPVWIWLGSIFKGAKRWKDSAYAITDKQIFIKNGATNMIVRWYRYDCIASVKKQTGILDDLLGTVDLKFYLVNGTHVDILDVKKSEMNGVLETVNRRIEEAARIRTIQAQKAAAAAEEKAKALENAVVQNESQNQNENISKEYGTNYNPYA